MRRSDTDWNSLKGPLNPKQPAYLPKSVTGTLKFRAEHDKFACQVFAQTKKKKKKKKKGKIYQDDTSETRTQIPKVNGSMPYWLSHLLMR